MTATATASASTSTSTATVGQTCATMRRRAAAWTIDTAVVAVATSVVVSLVNAAGMPAAVRMAFVPAAALLLWATYDIVGLVRWGRTVGRAAAGIRVVPDDPDRNRLTVPMAARRHLLRTTLPTLMSVAVGWWLIINLGAAAVIAGTADQFETVLSVVHALPLLILTFSIVADTDSRGWHDHAAATVVVTMKAR